MNGSCRFIGEGTQKAEITGIQSRLALNWIATWLINCIQFSWWHQTKTTYWPNFLTHHCAHFRWRVNKDTQRNLPFLQFPNTWLSSVSICIYVYLQYCFGCPIKINSCIQKIKFTHSTSEYGIGINLLDCFPLFEQTGPEMLGQRKFPRGVSPTKGVSCIEQKKVQNADKETRLQNNKEKDCLNEIMFALNNLSHSRPLVAHRFEFNSKHSYSSQWNKAVYGGHYWQVTLCVINGLLSSVAM